MHLKKIIACRHKRKSESVASDESSHRLKSTGPIYGEKLTAKQLEDNLEIAARQGSQLYSSSAPLSLPDAPLRRTVSAIKHDLVATGDWKVATACKKGARPTFEDAHAVELLTVRNMKIPFLGVYDGHGGDGVAKLLGQHLHVRFQANLNEQVKSDDEPTAEMVTFALRKSILDVDAMVLERVKGKQMRRHVGSTVSVFTVVGTWAYHAGVGDASTYCSIGGRQIRMCYHHLLEEGSDEYERIVKLGGNINNSQHGKWRIFDSKGRGGLAVPRAVGDHIYQNDSGQRIVIPEPFMTRIDLSSGGKKGAIVCCDGITGDFVSDIQLAAISTHHVPESVARAIAASQEDEDETLTTAKQIIKCAEGHVAKAKSVSGDNMTVIVTDFDPSGARALLERSKTPELPEFDGQ